MITELAEFRFGLRPFLQPQVCLASQVGRIEKTGHFHFGIGKAELALGSHMQLLDGARWIVAIQGDRSANGRQPVRIDHRIPRQALLPPGSPLHGPAPEPPEPGHPVWKPSPTPLPFAFWLRRHSPVRLLATHHLFAREPPFPFAQSAAPPLPRAGKAPWLCEDCLKTRWYPKRWKPRGPHLPAVRRLG